MVLTKHKTEGGILVFSGLWLWGDCYCIKMVVIIIIVIIISIDNINGGITTAERDMIT